jgi:hypothetical protein
MHRKASGLAIPVFRFRVAPVLNWCSKMLILGESAATCAAGQEMLLLNMSAFDRLRILRDEGICTLICGALSPNLLSYGEHLGLRIICGVAGDVDEVLRAYHTKQLDQPRFWLPGCTGQRNYRRNCLRAVDDGFTHAMKSAKTGGEDHIQIGTEGVLSQKPEPAAEKGRTGRMRGGVGGFCICPQCGMKIRHERGIPCAQIYCPQCDLPMARP